jgi:replicative DNA helicase
MTVQGFPIASVNSLLSEDAFQNEQSRRLFEAIDELRGCGANHEIDLPEVGSKQKT